MEEITQKSCLVLFQLWSLKEINKLVGYTDFKATVNHVSYKK